MCCFVLFKTASSTAGALLTNEIGTQLTFVEE
jgi:hypothetical protein